MVARSYKYWTTSSMTQSCHKQVDNAGWMSPWWHLSPASTSPGITQTTVKGLADNWCHKLVERRLAISWFFMMQMHQEPPWCALFATMFTDSETAGLMLRYCSQISVNTFESSVPALLSAIPDTITLCLRQSTSSKVLWTTMLTFRNWIGCGVSPGISISGSSWLRANS